ncbi:MAG: retention module-containing protein, partial [Rhodocyclaceae bacterium]|nr:retention module-containing protein [Rhodocyclaceae bacterium]
MWSHVMSQAVATVVAVIGKAYARSPEGVQRELTPGDVLREGETVVTGPGGRVELALEGGDLLTVQPEQVVQMSVEMLATADRAPDEGAVADGSIERVIQALEAGRDLNEEIEAPAAGNTGGGTGDGNDFVRLLRIAESVDPLSIESATAAGGTSTESVPAGDNGDDAPLAVDDSISTELSTTVVISVLANDRDPDGNPLTIVAVGGQPIAVGSPVTLDIGVVELNADGTLSFTPADGVEGIVSFPYTISDGSAEVSATVTVTVGEVPENDQPVAVDDTATTEAGEMLSGSLAGNDTPSQDGGNVWAVATAPSNGSVVVNADGTYTYTPADGFVGVDSFTYTITDADGDISTATVTIVVEEGGEAPPPPADDQPVAVDDVAAAPVDGSVSGDLSDNDTPSLDGGNVWAIGTLPANGTATVNADGTFTYTPDEGFEGQDSFTYVITDADGDTSSATVTILVGGDSDDAPVAVDDSFTVSPGSSVSGDLAANDTPSADGGNVWAIEELAGGGEVVVNADGTFTYTPDAGFAGLDSFTYTITDADGDVTRAVVNIDVAVPEGAPLAEDDAFVLDGTASVAGDLAANDQLSPDGGDTWALSAPPANGSATVNFDGTFSYTPNPGFTGIDTFTYTVSDVDGDSSTATVTITVNAVANQDPLAQDDLVPVIEDTRATGNVLTNDSDPEGADLTVTGFRVDINGDGNPEFFAPGSTAVIDGVGELTIDFDGLFTFDPAPDYSGPVPPATYTISDGAGGEDEAVLRLGPVSPANDDPTAQNDAAVVPINGEATGNVLDNDSDLDSDPLTVSSFEIDVDGDGVAESFAAGAVASIAGVGSLRVDANGDFAFTPVADYAGAIPVATYTVEDGEGGSATAELQLSMGGNQPPVAVDDELPVTEDTPASGNVLDNDSDADGNPISVTAFEVDTDGDGIPETFAPGETATISGVGTLVIAGNGDFTFEPDPDFTGDVPAVTYTVGDGLGGEDQAVLRLGPVSPVNDAPIAVDDGPLSTDEDTPLTGINVLGNDSDPDGDPLTVTSATSPNGTVVINPDGTLDFTPTGDFNGPTTITYTVDDGNGGTDTATVTINVNPVNDAPVANDDSGTTQEDVPVTFTAAELLSNDSDIDGDTLTIASVGPATNGTVVLNPDGTV